EEAGVADVLLVGRHSTADRLRDNTGKQAEAAQQHERPRVGGGWPFGRDQRSLGWKNHLENVADALVHMNLGRALRRVGKIAQDRRDPFDQKSAARIVCRPIDRPRRLWIRTGKIKRELLAALD